MDPPDRACLGSPAVQRAPEPGVGRRDPGASGVDAAEAVAARINAIPKPLHAGSARPIRRLRATPSETRPRSISGTNQVFVPMLSRARPGDPRDRRRWYRSPASARVSAPPQRSVRRGRFGSPPIAGGLNGELFVTLLRRLMRARRRSRHLILDGLPAHKPRRSRSTSRGSTAH